jgi:hypothetical protein
MGQDRANQGCRKLQKNCNNIPHDSQAPPGVWKLRREDLGRAARLESMFRLAVTLVFLVALAGALTDLARGRRPLLFG